MIISRDDSERVSLEDIRAFLAASEPVRFVGQKREETYGWVERTLVRLEYHRLGRSDRGLLRLLKTLLGKSGDVPHVGASR